MKRVVILIGAKGSGKTYLGALLEQRFNIAFLRVEPIFLKLKDEQLPFDDYVKKGFDIARDEIDTLLQNCDSVAFETTGAAAPIQDLIDYLASKYQVIKIRIDAPAEICRQRFKSRDQSRHIPVSDGFFDEINAQAGRYIDGYDATFRNYEKSDAEIAQFFQGLLSAIPKE
jgi:shikimate kinase